MEISNRELYDECLEIYDYNFEAFMLHIYFLTRQKNIKKTMVALKKDLQEEKNISNYRYYMFKVMDSFKSEIEEYKLITKFNIKGTHSSLLYCYDNIKSLKKINKDDKKQLEKELVEILFYSERLLKEINNGK